MRTLAALAALATLTAAATPAAADSAANFQLYTLGDLYLNGNNITQRGAAGGNATFVGTGVGGGSGSDASLVVGGDLKYINGGSLSGGALVGGANNAPTYIGGISAGQGVLPVNFDIENTRLKNLSSTLGGMTANGTANVQWGGLSLTGSDSVLNVFSITTSQLAQTNWLSTNINSNSQVLVNVFGSAASLGGGWSFNTPSNVLWNFVDATQLTMGGIYFGGSVLAPNAAFQGNGGTLAGNLIVGSFNGAMSFGGAGYAGNFIAPPPPPVTLPVDSPLPGIGMAVPEPGVWLMMILGFGGIGAALRRRRSQGFAAI